MTQMLHSVSIQAWNTTAAMHRTTDSEVYFYMQFTKGLGFGQHFKTCSPSLPKRLGETVTDLPTVCDDCLPRLSSNMTMHFWINWQISQCYLTSYLFHIFGSTWRGGRIIPEVCNMFSNCIQSWTSLFPPFSCSKYFSQKHTTSHLIWCYSFSILFLPLCSHSFLVFVPPLRSTLYLQYNASENNNPSSVFPPMRDDFLSKT